MFDMSVLIDEIDYDVSSEHGVHDIYEKACGFLTLEELFTLDHVYECARRCASGFMRKNDTHAFMSDPWGNSYRLCERVLSGEFRPRYYREQEIVERGKKRVIKPPTFECKVVQKVLCDFLVRPLFEHKMIQTNYASVKGRGTDKMFDDIIKALNKAIRDDEDFAVVTNDFSKYFDSIDLARLRVLFERFISDVRVVDLIMSFSECGHGGLSLGNELSQIPASYFPSVIDHTMKDRHALPYYRFQDDSLAIVPSDKVDWYVDEYKSIAGSIGLVCVPKKLHIIKSRKSFKFCKERFVWDGSKDKYVHLINPKRVSCEKRKIWKMAEHVGNGKMSIEEANMQFICVRGSIKSHCYSHKAVMELDETYKSAFGVSLSVS